MQWRFESAHGHHRRRLVAQLADVARSDRADRGSNPREPTIAASAGTILRGRGAARVAASLSAKSATGSNPVRPARMGSSFKGRIRGLHPRDEGSIPSGSTRAPSANGEAVSVSTRRCGFDSRWRHQVRCGGKGRRPWEPHKLHHAGSIPASATRRRFVQWKDGGLTSRSRGFDSLTGYQFDGGRRQTVRRGSVKPVLAGSTPAVHPKLSGRWVIGSPPASGAGPWRFESSRPDHCQIVQLEGRRP